MNTTTSTGMQGATPLRHIGVRVAGLLLGSLFAAAAAAQSPPVLALAAPAATGPENTVRMLLERETAGLSGRAEITMGQLDPHLSLAPCARIEPFLPPGTRAWGRFNVGMRCRDGANWTVYLPVTVKVFGPALTAKKSLMSGTPVADNDIEALEGELSREPGTPVSDLKQVEGRVLARALFPGQILRLEHFRAAPAVAQGDQVKLVAIGPGFTITTDGEALSQALEGQSVRVRTDTGRIVSGTARAGRTVELRF